MSRYVRVLGNMVHAIQIKTKLCQLVEVMMARRDDLSFCQEMKFRWVLKRAKLSLVNLIMLSEVQKNNVHLVIMGSGEGEKGAFYVCVVFFLFISFQISQTFVPMTVLPFSKITLHLRPRIWFCIQMDT